MEAEVWKMIVVQHECNEWQARSWVATELKVDPDTSVNLFETTIRVLGGLLAAFHLSNRDKVMLYKAASLALRLLPAFSSESGDPFPRLHSADLWGLDSSSLALHYHKHIQVCATCDLAAQIVQAFYLSSCGSTCSAGILMHYSSWGQVTNRDPL